MSQQRALRTENRGDYDDIDSMPGALASSGGRFETEAAAATLATAAAAARGGCASLVIAGGSRLRLVECLSHAHALGLLRQNDSDVFIGSKLSIHPTIIDVYKFDEGMGCGNSVKS